MPDVAMHLRAAHYAAVVDLLSELWRPNVERSQWHGRSAYGTPYRVFRLRPSRVTYVRNAFRFSTGVSLTYEEQTP